VNIYLTGFMGSGKTSVGRGLARLLGRRFVDLDAEVERSSRRSAAELFSKGERVFRGAESAALRRLRARDGLVVALGGGALLSAANRRLVSKSGILTALTCSEPELWRRLRFDPTARPLLGRGPAERQRLRRLLTRRLGLYREADITVSATRRSPAQVAALIAKRLAL
jgi:shikimate kinase